jgi:hypothetical protein
MEKNIRHTGPEIVGNRNDVDEKPMIVRLREQAMLTKTGMSISLDSGVEVDALPEHLRPSDSRHLLIDSAGNMTMLNIPQSENRTQPMLPTEGVIANLNQG